MTTFVRTLPLQYPSWLDPKSSTLPLASNFKWTLSAYWLSRVWVARALISAKLETGLKVLISCLFKSGVLSSIYGIWYNYHDLNLGIHYPILNRLYLAAGCREFELRAHWYLRNLRLAWWVLISCAVYSRAGSNILNTVFKKNIKI